MSQRSSVDFTGIERRLDALIRIVLESQKARDEATTIGDQILMLEDAGLLPSEAGGVLGIDSGQLTGYIKKAKNRRLKDKIAKKRKGSST